MEHDHTQTAELKVYLATVDLSRLGRLVRNGVKEGKIKDVYVLGCISEDGIIDQDENCHCSLP